MSPIWVLLGFLVFSQAEYRRFDGDVVLRCNFDFTNSEHRALYQSFIDAHPDEVDLWGRNDIRVTQQSRPRVTAALKAIGVSCETMIQDVQALIDAERIPAPAPDAPNPDPFFDNYRNWTDIHDWYRTQANNNSAIATFTQLNTTYENRPIMVFKVTNGAKGQKPVIFIHGGIHAREWISPATCAYIVGKALNKTDPNATYLLNNFELHVVPLVNVDGYSFTWTNNRQWRKTRKPNTGSTCIGTDPNRNWDNHWCEQGASRDPCSDSFCGSAAFTERETFTMANYVTTTRRTQPVRMYIDYHAYGQLWMSPWGWTNAATADATVQRNIGTLAINAIRGNSGLSYTYGPIYTTIYPASGSSVDWVYSNGVTYSYAVELRDTGTYGFTLPASQIRPQGEEIWAAMTAMVNALPR